MRMSRRESGLVLLSVLMVVMMLFATTAVVVNFSVSESEVLEQRLDELEAFYLAEGGIEAAKLEIIKGQDPDQDGLGTLAGSNSTGAYTVDAIETGSIYDLTAAGTASGGSVVTLETTIEIEYESVFPVAAMSFVGDLGETNMKFELDDDLILHGGSGPALSFSEKAVYDSIGQKFATAIEDTSFPAGNLVGGVTNTFKYKGKDYDLAIAYEPNYDNRLKDLSDLYDELDAKADALAATALVVSGLSGTYGDADNPVTIYSPGNTDVKNETVTGYGTLIIGKRMRLSKSTTVNWTGDIFVIGEDGVGGGSMRFTDATLNVTGNVFILGEPGGSPNVVDIWENGQVNIDGNFFLATDWDSTNGDVRLSIRGDPLLGPATFTVDGVMTMMGQNVKIKTNAEPLNSVVIDGMLQIAVPDAGTTTHLTLDFDGNFEVYNDVDKISAGMGLLQELGVEHNLLPQVGKIVKKTPTVRSWTKSGSGTGYGN